MLKSLIFVVIKEIIFFSETIMKLINLCGGWEGGSGKIIRRERVCCTDHKNRAI
jgi:hypothetical protein